MLTQGRPATQKTKASYDYGSRGTLMTLPVRLERPPRSGHVRLARALSTTLSVVTRISGPHRAGVLVPRRD
eukprot:6510794-Pyramimonas_sp.AAC.1